MQASSSSRNDMKPSYHDHDLTTYTQAGYGSYYSNRDISILHSIVTAAQNQLDHSTDPKPLPAAVLFKAYDDILPACGVDPDSDQHLSAFVFRIGGEGGHGTLLEKFQVILNRMGIILEFADDLTTSASNSVYGYSSGDSKHIPSPLQRSSSGRFSIIERTVDVDPPQLRLPAPVSAWSNGGPRLDSLQFSYDKGLDASEEAAASNCPRQEQLLRCAARACQIYFASRVFHCWANRAAVRLEREAVAKRHMMRFRCFQGWSQRPHSNLTAIDHLRAAKAIQKLHRVVTTRERKLRSTAVGFISALSTRFAEQFHARWRCRVSEYLVSVRSATQVKTCWFERWKRDVSEASDHKRASLEYSVRHSQSEARHIWALGARENHKRLLAARQVKASRLCLTSIRNWLEQAEGKRRGASCALAILTNRTTIVFGLWNLHTRAQAFRWRSEYLSVRSSLAAWLKNACQACQSSDAADSCYELSSRAKYIDRCKQTSIMRAYLSHFHGRALLYIRGNVLLRSLSESTVRRKDQMKTDIRRYLMIRYTQASSRRKERYFFAALDAWRAASAVNSNRAYLAADFTVATKAGQRLAILLKWGNEITVQWLLQTAAQHSYIREWLLFWGEHAARQGNLEVQTQGLWIFGERRHCYKAWAIATLRRSGQAHTATMVRQRHHREGQSRILRCWKLSSSAVKAVSPAALRTSQPRSGPRSSHQSLGVEGSGRLQSKKRQEYLNSLMETPTRWTGLPAPIAEAISPRRRRSSADEVDNQPQSVGSASGSEQLSRKTRFRICGVATSPRRFGNSQPGLQENKKQYPTLSKPDLDTSGQTLQSSRNVRQRPLDYTPLPRPLLNTRKNL
ncbi:hypothetical protein CDD83_4643 [Cordyceps sp. RAO-2017]|nr:hypothetical protein CDD83_4643 [Cordyceps sp. RAO-2017]